MKRISLVLGAIALLVFATAGEPADTCTVAQAPTKVGGGFIHLAAEGSGTDIGDAKGDKVGGGVIPPPIQLARDEDRGGDEVGNGLKPTILPGDRAGNGACDKSLLGNRKGNG